MRACTRVVYYESDKQLAIVLHRIDGGAERPNEPLIYVDIPYDDFDPLTHYISGVDEDGNPIVGAYAVEETEEQKRIKELEEDVLLLQAENEIGGIL